MRDHDALLGKQVPALIRHAQHIGTGRHRSNIQTAISGHQLPKDLAALRIEELHHCAS